MEDEVAHLLTVNFNQDAKSLAVGHREGYMLYSTAEVLEDPSSLLHDSDSSTNIHEAIIVERLFNSSLVVIVSQKEPRVMHVYHFSSRNMICDHKFSKSILNVKLNRERVIVCLEDSIYIYNLKDMKLMHTIMDTPVNRMGLVDLSAESSAVLAYPGSAETGSVNIFDTIHLNSVNNFAAHEGPLAALKFNLGGTMLATASTRGTVIRVFSVPTGNRLFEFRRGVARCVTINSLAFSADSGYLCTSSNTETVHVFKLDKQAEPEKKQESTAPAEGGWFGYLTQAASTYLPTQVNDLMTVERSFATARLPGNDKKSIAAMPTIKGQPYLLVATTDGFLYCYSMDSAGGECNLIKQQRIGPNADHSKGTEARPRAPTDDSNSVPNTDDAGEFPPITHSTG